MSKIDNFALLPTENLRVGRSKLAEFFYEHIQSLKAEDKPEYADIITESETVYDDVFSDISLHNQNLNEQKNLTIEVNEVKNEFYNLINSFDAALILKFHKNSKEQKEVFPRGCSAFKRRNIDEIRENMELLEKKGAEFDVRLNTTFADDFKNVRIKYLNIFDKQKSTQTQVKSIIPNYKVKKKLIDVQILKNICIILLNNLNQPEILRIYFNDPLIATRHKTKTAKNNKTHLLKVAPNTHIAAKFTYTAKDILLISNNSTISVFYYAAATANAPIASTLTEILADEEVEVAASTLGAGNKYIIFVNKDTTIEAEVEIAFI